MDDAINKLQEIGLNKMESEVYHLLLRTEPMTAYKIGKLLNKPTANIYKAVDALHEKGAVIIQSGNKNTCKAVEYELFLNTLEHEFSRKTKNVSKSLSKIKKQEDEDGTYVLKSSDLVVEKVKNMIDTSSSVIVLNIFFELFQKIETNLQNAINRGVRVNIITYTNEIKLKNAEVVVSSIGQTIMEKWKSQQLNIIVDSKESMISLFSLDLSVLHHGLWRTNPYLCYTLQTLFMTYNIINRVMNTKESQNRLKEIEEILNNLNILYSTDAPGFKMLMEK